MLLKWQLRLYLFPTKIQNSSFFFHREAKIWNKRAVHLESKAIAHLRLAQDPQSSEHRQCKHNKQLEPAGPRRDGIHRLRVGQVHGGAQLRHGHLNGTYAFDWISKIPAKTQAKSRRPREAGSFTRSVDDGSTMTMTSIEFQNNCYIMLLWFTRACANWIFHFYNFFSLK